MKIYCSGIGGIGLSAYASLQNAKGNTVLGSDRTETPLTKSLQEQGIDVSTNQDGAHVPDDLDLFVYSEAIPEDAPERVRAKKLGVEQQSYFKALGELSKDYQVIAVCGTHGKSSTTAMAAKVLIDAGIDPTVVVGTKVPQLDGRNWRQGESDIFLLEACEYRGSFLNLHPNVILMTNVDGDHFDAYDSVEDYQKAYEEFLARLPDDGVIITHATDSDCKRIANSSQRTVIDADQIPGSKITLSIPGGHMRQNAQLVTALGSHLELEAATVSNALKNFTGTWRRMEEKGKTTSGAIVVDDYAHHPLEVNCTIAAAQEKYPGKRIVCLFQPHMFNRIERFYDTFLRSFTGADLVLVTDVYEARREGNAPLDIAEFTRKIPQESIHVGSMENAEQYCRTHLQENDVLLVMGAGDVTNVATNLVT
jgi:UDP-N-acetylmuramate--alanine ligase